MKSFVIAATLIFALAPLPAAAEEGAWKVGDTYVVRSGALDLATESGRNAYFEIVERAAKAQCRNEDTQGRRERCVADTIAAAVDGSSPRARKALTLVLEQRGQPETQAVALAE